MTATTFRGPTLVSYPVHVLLMSVSARFWLLLIETSLTWAGFVSLKIEKYDVGEASAVDGNRCDVQYIGLLVHRSGEK